MNNCFLGYPLKFVVILIFFYYSAPSFSANVSLQDLVKMALEQSPVISGVRHNFEISKLKVKVARASFLPSLDLSTSQGMDKQNIKGQADRASSMASLTLSENLYDNHKSIYKYQSASDSKRLQEIKLEKETAQICLNVSREYFNYSFASYLIDVNQKLFSSLSNQFNSIENLYKQGLTTRRDYLRFKTRLQRANITLQNSLVELEKSKAEMRRITGVMEEDFNIARWTVNKNDIELIPITELELTGHYDLKIIDLQKQINMYDVKISEREYWPELNIDSKLSYNRPEYLRGGGETGKEWSTMLTLNFNLWDWGKRSNSLSIVKANNLVKEYQYKEELNSLQVKMKNLFLNITQQKRNFGLNKDLLTLEEQNYLSIEKDYYAGKAFFVDIINALNDYTSTQEAFYRNYFEMHKSLSEYYYHQGTLYEKISGK